MERIRVRPSPREALLRFVEKHPEGITRSQAAREVDRTYWSARYHLERMVELGLIRSERIWTVRHFVRRVIYYPIIVPPKWELVHAMVVIYSLTESPPPREYKYRFQGFYNVDALRDARTGRFKYDAPLTGREIRECLLNFRAHWGWYAVGPPDKKGLTSEPVFIETSEFEFIKEVKGAILKSLSKIEDGEETYWSSFMEMVYVPTEEEKKEMMREIKK